MKLFVFLCVLLTCFQAANARPGHRSTADIRLAWKNYKCDTSSMVTLMVNESDPKNTALVMVHKKAVEAFRSLHGVMEMFQFAPSVPLLTTGGYACSKNKSSGKESLHAYGIAADYDWERNKYQSAASGKLSTTMDDKMIAAIEEIKTVGGEQVFRWGGRYAGNKSPMHFEIIVSPKALAMGIQDMNIQLRAGFSLGSLINFGKKALTGGGGGGNILSRGLEMLGQRGGKLGKIANVVGTLTQPGSIADKITAVAGALGPKGEAIGGAISALTGQGSAMDKIGAIANAAGQLTQNPKINAITNFVGNAASSGQMPDISQVLDLAKGLRGNPGSSVPSPTNNGASPTNNGGPPGTNSQPFNPPNPIFPSTGPPGFTAPVTGAPTQTTSTAPGGGTIQAPAPRVVCQSFSCPSGSSYKFGMNPAAEDCQGQCDARKCCSQNQLCGAIGCGAGATHRNKQKMCTTSQCSQNECCVALPAKDCSHAVCPANHHKIANAALVDCPLGGCDPGTCCKLNARCSSLPCVAPATAKLSPPTSCAGAMCTSDECCDTPASPTAGAGAAKGKCADVQCGTRTPLTTAASVTCAGASCTLDECCNKAPAQTPTTNPTTGGSQSSPNRSRAPPTFDAASFGGRDGSLPDKVEDRPFEDTEVNGMLVAGGPAVDVPVDDTDEAEDANSAGTSRGRSAAQREAAKRELAEQAKKDGKVSFSSDTDTAQILMIVGIVIGAICLLLGAGFAVCIVKRKGESQMRGAQNYYRQSASPVGGAGRMPAAGHGSASGARISNAEFERGLPSSLSNYNRNPASISVAMAGGIDNQDFYRQGRLYSDVDDGFSTHHAAAATRGV